MLPAALTLLASTAMSHPALSAEAAPTVEVPFEEYDLDNGLHVVLHPDHRLPQVTVNIWYKVGSKDEQAGRSGFAHLFEHLMFMGTERVPGSGFDDTMEAEGGWNNAWTSEDATDYYSVGPSNLLETLLWLDADRMEGLAKAMTQEKLDLQRDVVRNERRQSYEDAPYGAAWLALNEVLYPPGHPYAHPVIGSHEDLQAAQVDDVKNFFNTWYVPNNASLVVAGDFDPEAVKPFIARTFGAIEPRALPERVAPDPVDLPAKHLVELTDQVRIPMSLLAWHTPASMEEGDAECDLAASILATGRTSRLYRRLVHEDRIALDVSAAQYSQQLGSIFLVTVMPAEGHTLEEVEAAVQEEIARLAKDGPTPEELDRARTRIEVDFLRRVERLQDRATALNRYWAITGAPGGFQADLDRYRNATAEGVRQAAARLTPERAAIIRVRPEATEDNR